MPRSGTVVHAEPAGVRPPADARAGSTTAVDVVVLSASGQLGGAERALLDMVTALQAHDGRLRVTVLIAATGPLATEVRNAGADVCVLPLPEPVARLGDAVLGGGGVAARLRSVLRLLAAVPPLLSYLRQLSTALREARPRIVHTNGFKMHVLGALVRPRGSRVVWHLHDFTSTRPIMSRALRVLAPRAAIAVANSVSVARDATRVWGAALPVVTVYNALDLDRFAPTGPRAELDALAGMAPAPSGTVRIGLVATLASWKGHEVLLRAIARLSPGLPIRAYIVSGPIYQTAGSEASLTRLRALAERLQIADRVGFTGFVENVPSVMRALDVVVHASTLPEPFGLVIAEGMACARAVIVSAAGGAAELIRPEVNALAFTPGDDAMLAQQIERLVERPELRARIGAAARASALERFDRRRLGVEIAAAHRAALEAP